MRPKVSGFRFQVSGFELSPKTKDQVRRQKAAGRRQAAAGRRLSPDLNERIPSRNSLNCCRDLKARNSLLSPLQGDESLWDVIQGCVPGKSGLTPGCVLGAAPLRKSGSGKQRAGLADRESVIVNRSHTGKT